MGMAQKLLEGSHGGNQGNPHVESAVGTDLSFLLSCFDICVSIFAKPKDFGVFLLTDGSLPHGQER